MTPDGIWAPQYTFQLIDLDTNAAHAKKALAAVQERSVSEGQVTPTTPTLPPSPTDPLLRAVRQPTPMDSAAGVGKLRGRSESGLLTRTGEYERLSELGLTPEMVTDNGPRVTRILELGLRLMGVAGLFVKSEA